MKTRTIVLTGATGLGLAALTALQAARAGAPAAPARPVRPLTATVAAEGRVIGYPDAEVVVGAERGGRLVRVAVVEGQTVRKGDLLAEIESDELRASLAEARARVAEAEAEIRLAEATLKRRRDLAEQKIVAPHDLDQAQRDLDTARARAETARAAVARDEAQLRKTRIVSPIAGTVVGRHVDTGEMVDSGTRIATVADLRRLRIDGEADEADAAALAVGAPVAITADGFPGRRFRGRVEEVADSVTLRKLKPQDPSRPTDARIVAVKVAFAEPAPLKLGTTVELRISSSSKGALEHAGL
jgi:HlyD family secretion protein